MPDCRLLTTNVDSETCSVANPQASPLPCVEICRLEMDAGHACNVTTHSHPWCSSMSRTRHYRSQVGRYPSQPVEVGSKDTERCGGDGGGRGGIHPCGALGPRTKAPQCLSLLVAASSLLHVPNTRVNGIEASAAKGMDVTLPRGCDTHRKLTKGRCSLLHAPQST